MINYLTDYGQMSNDIILSGKIQTFKTCPNQNKRKFWKRVNEVEVITSVSLNSSRFQSFSTSGRLLEPIKHIEVVKEIFADIFPDLKIEQTASSSNHF